MAAKGTRGNKHLRASMKIRLEANTFTDIANHGERDYPYECCGALLGNFDEDGLKVVSETYAISNAREEEAKRTRFLITPAELVKCEKTARSKQLEIVGFYHSHPNHPAIPSAYDLEHAWPVYSYIVVSVQSGKSAGLRSWELSRDRSVFVEEEILKGAELCQ